MMGTGPFAVPTFRALLDSPHDIRALVTRPDRPPAHGKHRHQPPPNPMRQAAEERGVAVFAPESVNSPESLTQLREWQADLFVVCDYGQILSREALSLARLGGINLHGSLLPKYRGAAPVQWAVYYGETETGVSVIHMTPRLDAGPVLLQRRLAIEPNETAGQLEERLAALGPEAVLEAIARLTAGDATGIPQDGACATKAPRLTKADGLIDWRRSAVEIRNQVRAMDPWPTAYTFWLRPRGAPMRLILDSVSVSSELPSALPGIIVAADAGAGLLKVACGRGELTVNRLQPAGKKPMSAAEFLRGHPLQIGERLAAI